MIVTDEEGEGGEEVEQRAYADVRQLEAAAKATRKLAGRRKLKALPPVPTAPGSSGENSTTVSLTTGDGTSAVAEKMPLSGNEKTYKGSVKQGLQGFFAVSRGRQTGKWRPVKSASPVIWLGYISLLYPKPVHALSLKVYRVGLQQKNPS